MPRGDLKERFSTFTELERAFDGCEQSWLSTAERERLGQFRDSRRRTAWTWGRVLSKQLMLEVAADFATTPRSITIQSHDANGRGTAPTVRFSGVPQSCRLSISHSDRAVFVALSKTANIGIDLVDLDGPEFSQASRRLWFTHRELEQLDAAGDANSLRVFWAAKEAAFKACRNDRSFAPRQIEITAQTPTTLSARCRFPLETRQCEITVRRHNRHVVATAIETAGSTIQRQHHRQHDRIQIPC